MRQQNDSQQCFRDVLTSLRNYTTTPRQAEWLQQFQWHHLVKKYGNNILQQIKSKGLFIFPTHAEEWEHNKAKLLNAEFPVLRISAVCHGPHSKQASAD